MDKDKPIRGSDGADLMGMLTPVLNELAFEDALREEIQEWDTKIDRIYGKVMSESKWPLPKPDQNPRERKDLNYHLNGLTGMFKMVLSESDSTLPTTSIVNYIRKRSSKTLP